uniref:Vesicle transport protein n=1 Tax=Syphacia muris TaxID=451379 RepID=A0A0N5AKM1_9BILA
MHCFIGCLFLSLLCSALGSVLIFHTKIVGFTVMVSVGNIISILGTFFLSPPLKQLKNMLEKGHLIVFILYVVLTVLTLIAGLVLKNPFLSVAFVIGEYLAMIWYTASYIPFGRFIFKIFH